MEIYASESDTVNLHTGKCYIPLKYDGRSLVTAVGAVFMKPTAHPLCTVFYFPGLGNVKFHTRTKYIQPYHGTAALDHRIVKTDLHAAKSAAYSGFRKIIRGNVFL